MQPSQQDRQKLAMLLAQMGYGDETAPMAQDTIGPLGYAVGDYQPRQPAQQVPPEMQAHMDRQIAQLQGTGQAATAGAVDPNLMAHIAALMGGAR